MLRVEHRCDKCPLTRRSPAVGSFAEFFRPASNNANRRIQLFPFPPRRNQGNYAAFFAASRRRTVFPYLRRVVRRTCSRAPCQFLPLAVFLDWTFDDIAEHAVAYQRRRGRVTATAPSTRSKEIDMSARRQPTPAKSSRPEVPVPAPCPQSEDGRLCSQTIGALPILNQILRRTRLEDFSARRLAARRPPHEALAGQGPLGLAPQSACLPRTDLRRGRMGCTPRRGCLGLDAAGNRPAERRLRGTRPSTGCSWPMCRRWSWPWRRTSSRSSASPWTNCTTIRPRFPSAGPTPVPMASSMPRPSHAGHHLRPQQGPSSRSEATPVHSHRHRRRRRAVALPRRKAATSPTIRPIATPGTCSAS